MHRTSAVDRAILDGLLALLVTGLALASLAGSAAHLQLTRAAVLRLHTADALGVALLVLGTLSIGKRRDVPVLVLGVAAMAFLGYDALGHAPLLLPFAPAIALYTIAATRTPLVAVSATTVTAVVGAGAGPRVVRFVRLIHRRGRAFWRSFGPRRLRRQLEDGLVAT